MIRELRDAKEILVYHKGCYGCGHTAHLYDTLQKYLVDQLAKDQSYKIPKFQVRRIDFDVAWQDELESAGLKAPAVRIEKENGEILWVDYKELEQDIKDEKEFKEKLIKAVIDNKKGRKNGKSK